jgi:hypothetical protein
MVALIFPRTSSQTRTGSSEVRTPAAPLPAHDEIAERAYEIYVRNGRQEGRQQEDWLQAEHELIEEAHNSPLALAEYHGLTSGARW